MQDAEIYPDLVGKDRQGCPIIVEVKFKFEYQGDAKSLRRDPENTAIRSNSAICLCV